MRKQSVEIKRLNQGDLRNFVEIAEKISHSDEINYLSLTLTNLNYKFGRLRVACCVLKIIIHTRYPCQFNLMIYLKFQA